ncbi:MAG: helix-turn-helix transcriptional regulator [Clostridiaceae bacterium]|nr:helix-turn-helix transcriptional regulator [Clostridiaceae bacterium]
MPDACYIYPPGTKHYFKSNGPLLHNWFHFDEISARDWADVGLKYNKVYYIHPSNFISDIVYQIELEYANKRTHYEKIINSKICELFVKIARANEETPLFFAPKTIEPFYEFRLNMLRNIGEKWTIKKMADSINMSQSYFHVVYKKIFGLSPMQDLIKARIASAQELLANTNIPISEIAFKTGYMSPEQFTHQFTHITGTSPREYRKAMLTSQIIK